MEKSDIRKILRNPSKELVSIALSYVNLTEKEKQILEQVEMKGITEEKAAEILEISVRGLQQTKTDAFTKLNIVWSNNLFISLMLKERT